MDLLTFIANFFWIGFWVWVGMKLFDRLNKVKEKQTQKYELISQVELKKIVTIKTETHGEQIYGFDMLTDNFLGQGKTIEEVAEAAYKFNKIDLAFVQHDGEEFWFMNGKATKTNVKLL